MAEPGSVASIKSRIAALNLEEVHAPAPGTRPAYSYEQATAKKKPPPPPPPANRPPGQPRQHSVNVPPVLSNASTSVRHTGNQPIAPTPATPKSQPALPPRPPPRASTQPSPSLPPRNKSQQTPTLPPRKNSEYSLKRKESTESISTIASGISTLSLGSAKTNLSGTSNGGQMYHIRAPAFDASKLPPLPPKKTPEEAKAGRATLKAMKSASNITNASKTLPPQLPSRPPLPARQDSKFQSDDSVQPQKSHVLPPPRRSALSFGLNKSTEAPPSLPSNRPSANATPGVGSPPPIPMGSRPDLNAIMASKPKPGATGFCLRCRDFSGPDKHAAQYPRQNLPSSDVGWLAAQLTSPFPSATDKARAIFTWLHYNIEYDTQSFFGGTVTGSTPERTLTSGLAVCEGYAGLFAALAMKAGLEAVVVGGHGKGFGFSAMKPGDPVPKFNCGHAWNAVKIDHGEWKLIDPCWGAGVVNGSTQKYERGFNAAQFTMDNCEFGNRHFPEDNRYFFRSDGRASISWEEYCLDDVPERLQIYGPAGPEHGLGERTFQPERKQIKLNDPQGPSIVRFQFASVCPHWDNEKNGKGKPYVMVLHTGGKDGRNSEWLPFQTDGKVWWLDVNRVDLGAPGQKVSVFSVDKIEGKDARGVSVQEYKSKNGRVAMGPFGGVAMWELVSA